MILGSANVDEMVELLQAFFSGDANQTLSRLNVLLDSGANVMQLASDLTGLMRQLLFVKMGVADGMELDEERKQKLALIASSVASEHLAHVLEAFAKTEAELRTFPNPALLMQVRFVSLLGVKGEAPRVLAPRVEAPRAEAPRAQAPKQEARKIEPEKIEVRRFDPPKIEAGGDAARQWQDCVEKLKTVKPGLYAILRNSSLLSLTETALNVALKQDFKFFREKLKEPSNQEALRATIRELFGKSLQLAIPGEPLGAEEQKNAPVQEAPQPSRPNPGADGTLVAQGASADASQSKKINQIVAMFEGTLVE
jgi:DNA polymerase III gamma/tau subunit